MHVHAQRELPALPTASTASTTPGDVDLAPPARSTTPLNMQKTDLAKNSQAQTATPELHRRPSVMVNRAGNAMCGTRYMTSCAGAACADANAAGKGHVELLCFLTLLIMRLDPCSQPFSGAPEQAAPESAPSGQATPAQNVAHENVAREGHISAHGTGGAVKDDNADVKGALALVESLSARLAEEEAQKTKAKRRLYARASVNLTAVSAAIELVQRHASEQSELVKSTFTSVSERVRVRYLYLGIMLMMYE